MWLLIFVLLIPMLCFILPEQMGVLAFIALCVFLPTPLLLLFGVLLATFGGLFALHRLMFPKRDSVPFVSVTPEEICAALAAAAAAQGPSGERE